MAQIIQATWAKAGIELEIMPGDNKQTLTKYRARTHDIYIGRWGPDYQDPHTNADTFACNPDNSDEAQLTGKLAWRNAWDIPEMTAETEAAVLEQDPDKRAADVSRRSSASTSRPRPSSSCSRTSRWSPSAPTSQGMIWGPSFDDNKYWKGTRASRPAHGRSDGLTARPGNVVHGGGSARTGEVFWGEGDELPGRCSWSAAWR